MKRIGYIIIFTMLLPAICFSQIQWTSKKYNYSIEIPQGFSESTPVGSNVDFKATKGLSTIVIVLKSIPSEYSSYTIWEILGDLTTFGKEWELGASEYMNNPKFIKYGKTKINNIDTFWYDYVTDNPTLYSKTYQFSKNNLLYTITLTCPYDKYNYYSPIWYRFKNSIRLKKIKKTNKKKTILKKNKKYNIIAGVIQKKKKEEQRKLSPFEKKLTHISDDIYDRVFLNTKRRRETNFDPNGYEVGIDEMYKRLNNGDYVKRYDSYMPTMDNGKHNNNNTNKIAKILGIGIIILLLIITYNFKK